MEGKLTLDLGKTNIALICCSQRPGIALHNKTGDNEQSKNSDDDDDDDDE